MVIDTHAHLFFEQFKSDFSEVVGRARAAGVGRIINVGVGDAMSRECLRMAKANDGLFATFGVHPYDAAEVNDELMEEWKKLILENSEIVAVGECGLDYFKAVVPVEVQKKGFRLQLELAREVGLPVIIHNREADDDCLEILSGFGDVAAVFHCFSGGFDMAKKIWDMGKMLSFTGSITYKKKNDGIDGGDFFDVIREMPLDRFMVETDCPFLAPQKYRGQRNEPAYVVEIVSKIAEIRCLEFEEIAKYSTENALKFFGRIKA